MVGGVGVCRCTYNERILVAAGVPKQSQQLNYFHVDNELLKRQ